MSFQRILAALDSPDVEVLNQAIQAAQLYQADLKLLHCIDYPLISTEPLAAAPAAGFPLGVVMASSQMPPQTAQEVWETQREQAHAWLAEQAEKAIAQNISVTYEVESGEPGP